jgi:hypothetical protein
MLKLSVKWHESGNYKFYVSRYVEYLMTKFFHARNVSGLVKCLNHCMETNNDRLVKKNLLHGFKFPAGSVISHQPNVTICLLLVATGQLKNCVVESGGLKTTTEPPIDLFTCSLPSLMESARSSIFQSAISVHRLTLEFHLPERLKKYMLFEDIE